MKYTGLPLILLVAALVCFILAGLGVQWKGLSWQWFGFAFLLAFMLA